MVAELDKRSVKELAEGRTRVEALERRLAAAPSKWTARHAAAAAAGPDASSLPPPQPPLDGRGAQPGSGGGQPAHDLRG
jgi:hypothetical protein